MFQDCSALASVIMPADIKIIGEGVFDGCSSLTSITIPNSVKEIGESAFAGCGLTSIIIPESVTNIGIYAFGGCSKLETVEIPASFTGTIGEEAFAGCAITSIYLPDCDVSKIVFGNEYEKEAYKQLKNVYCYPSVYNKLYYGYPRILMGGSIYTVSYSSTQTTIELRLSEKTASAKVPDGWPTYSVKKASVSFSGKEYVLNGDETISITGLVPSNSYYGNINVEYDKGRTYNKSFGPFSTGHLYALTTIVECGPTSITVTGRWDVGDAHIKRTYFSIYKKPDYSEGKNLDGDNVCFTGLKPGTDYEYVYNVVTVEGSFSTWDGEFTTPALELTTLQPKCVSSSCAIVAAKTNISDDEPSVGFQWKKYDAPESLNPNEGYAAIYNGQLEGYIKNLQPTLYYNVRAFYKSAGGTYYYGDWVTFDPSDFSYFEPTVHTYNVTDVTSNTAKVKGYVMAGTDDITEQGFEYRPLDSNDAKKWAMIAAAADNPGDDVITVFATGQVMTAELRDLKPETTYTCRAFVKTATGTTYGEEQTFTTTADVTGIATVDADASKLDIECCYDLSGRKIDTMQHGINIIRYTDGTTRKVFVR